jgi:hypothetical protein
MPWPRKTKPAARRLPEVSSQARRAGRGQVNASWQMMRLLLAIAALLLGACSTVEKLNPFRLQRAQGQAGRTGGHPADRRTEEPVAGPASAAPAASVFARRWWATASMPPGVTAPLRASTAAPGLAHQLPDSRFPAASAATASWWWWARPRAKCWPSKRRRRETWKARVSSEVLAAPAVAEDGLAIVRSGDSRIFGFDAADGKRRWVYQRSTPSLSLRSNVGVLHGRQGHAGGFPGGKLVAIANNNGAAVWEVTVALPKGATELERVADVTSSARDQRQHGLRRGLPGAGRLLRQQHRQYPVVARHVVQRRPRHRQPLCLCHRRQGRRACAGPQQRGQHLEAGQAGPAPVVAPLALGNHVAVADYQGVVHLLRRRMALLRPVRRPMAARCGPSRCAMAPACWCRPRTAACSRWKQTSPVVIYAYGFRPGAGLG